MLEITTCISYVCFNSTLHQQLKLQKLLTSSKIGWSKVAPGDDF